jgi:hypothetical protein
VGMGKAPQATTLPPAPSPAPPPAPPAPPAPRGPVADARGLSSSSAAYLTACPPHCLTKPPATAPVPRPRLLGRLDAADRLVRVTPSPSHVSAAAPPPIGRACPPKSVRDSRGPDCSSPQHQRAYNSRRPGTLPAHIQPSVPHCCHCCHCSSAVLLACYSSHLP